MASRQCYGKMSQVKTADVLALLFNAPPIISNFYVFSILLFCVFRLLKEHHSFLRELRGEMVIILVSYHAAVCLSVAIGIGFMLS